MDNTPYGSLANQSIPCDLSDEVFFDGSRLRGAEEL